MIFRLLGYLGHLHSGTGSRIIRNPASSGSFYWEIRTLEATVGPSEGNSLKFRLIFAWENRIAPHAVCWYAMVLADYTHNGTTTKKHADILFLSCRWGSCQQSFIYSFYAFCQTWVCEFSRKIQKFPCVGYGQQKTHPDSFPFPNEQLIQLVSLLLSNNWRNSGLGSGTFSSVCHT